MAIEKTVSNDFLSTFVDSINVFDCRLPGVILLFLICKIFCHCRVIELALFLIWKMFLFVLVKLLPDIKLKVKFYTLLILFYVQRKRNKHKSLLKFQCKSRSYQSFKSATI